MLDRAALAIAQIFFATGRLKSGNKITKTNSSGIY